MIQTNELGTVYVQIENDGLTPSIGFGFTCRLTPDDLRAAAADAELAGDWLALRAVAVHPLTPDDVLARFVGRAAEADGAPNLLGGAVFGAVGSPTEIARRRRFDAGMVELLTLAAASPCAHVRLCVTSHPASPPSLLAGLASDPDRSVRRRVETHPSTPPATRHALRVEFGLPALA